MDFLRYRLARRYQVTETVIAYRMESLKYEFFQYLSGTPLEDLHFLSRRELSKQEMCIRDRPYQLSEEDADFLIAVFEAHKQKNT